MLRQALSAELRPVVAATFADRVVGEREARARFTRLARELDETGASRCLSDLARRAADDEDRHAKAFAAWAGELGHETDPDTPFVAAPVGYAGLPHAERVLVEVVSLCCLAETVATAVLAAAIDTTSVGAVKDQLHSVLKDEVRHARLGWAHLAVERKNGRGAALAAILPELLEAGVPTERVERTVWPLAPELGLLPKQALFSLLKDVLREVIFPGLEGHHVDTAPARAWARTRGLG